MSSNETLWLFECLFSHLAACIGIFFAVKLWRKEYQKQQRLFDGKASSDHDGDGSTGGQRGKNATLARLPKTLKYSEFGIIIGSVLMILALSFNILPYICTYLRMFSTSELMYSWLRLGIFYFQSERLRNVFGDKSRLQFGYPNWLFIGFDCYLMLNVIFAVYMVIIKKQENFSKENNEYYYRGCYQVNDEDRAGLVTIQLLMANIADWFVLLLYFIKIRQLSKFVSSMEQISQTLRNVLKELFGLALSMELLTFISVLTSITLSYQPVTTVSVIIDTLWTIMAIRFMFEHNADEFKGFKHGLHKYFGKIPIINCCCCLCLCKDNVDVYDDVNVAMSTNKDKDTDIEKPTTTTNDTSGQTGSSGPSNVSDVEGISSTPALTGHGSAVNSGSKTPLSGTKTPNTINFTQNEREHNNTRDKSSMYEDTVVSGTTVGSNKSSVMNSPEDSVL